MRLRELLGGVPVLAWAGDPDVEVTGITHDSRRATRGSCFACIPGQVTDGHRYASDAADAGAVALLVERDVPVPVTRARVESVRQVLGPAAAALHDRPSRAMRCLGVTGTNGKTTTTYLLQAVATAHRERAGVIGTLGARIDRDELPLERTTPEADELQGLLATMRGAGVGTVAIEVSSHALDQHRVDGTWFAAAGFTNLTQDHLDYHRTMEAYFEAKASLFQRSTVAAAAVNVGDRYGNALARRLKEADIPLLTFGASDERRGVHVDVLATDVEIDRDGARFVIVDHRTGQRAPVRSRLVGRLNVSNAVAAAAIALAGGLPFDAVTRGLSTPVVIPGRLEVVESRQPFTVLVDYAHTPDALTRALDAARSVAKGGRVVIVFGCGGDRDRDKRAAMGRAAGRGADVVVVTSDNPRSEDPAAIAADILPGLAHERAPHAVELDRRAAIRLALADAQPGDVVLIAGKGHETGQSVDGRTVPFDDRVVAREELKGR